MVGRTTVALMNADEVSCRVRAHQLAPGPFRAPSPHHVGPPFPARWPGFGGQGGLYRSSQEKWSKTTSFLGYTIWQKKEVGLLDQGGSTAPASGRPLRTLPRWSREGTDS